MLVYKDRVKQLTTTTGTGSYALSTTYNGYKDFTAFSDADQTCYCCENGVDWEIGIGTVSAVGSVLSRDTILSSSAGDAIVNWGAGSKVVYCVYPSQYVFSSIGGKLQSYAEYVGTANDGVIDVSDSGSNVFTMTPSAPITVSFTGAIAGQCHSVTVHIIGGDSQAVTWPASVTFIGGTPFPVSAYDIITIHTIDGGTTWYLAYVGAA
jgi:hypothetical protein